MAHGRQEEVTLPVFLINSQLPGAEEKPYSTVEICQGAEKTSGINTIEGAQRIRGLWRLYVKDTDSRLALLCKGIALRGSTITPRDVNPYIVKTGNGEMEAPTTKLFVSDIPISFANDEIQTVLSKLNVKMRSRLIEERARDEHGKLTRFKTGRRIVFIEMPKTPLPKEVNIGPFRATLFHKEMRVPKCSRCLNTGHHVSACTNPVKCRQCLQDGHITGSEHCQLVPPTPAPISDVSAETDNSKKQMIEIADIFKKKQICSQERSRSYSPRPSNTSNRGQNSTSREKRPPSRSPSRISPQLRTKGKAPRINSPPTANPRNQQQDSEPIQESEDSKTT